MLTSAAVLLVPPRDAASDLPPLGAVDTASPLADGWVRHRVELAAGTVDLGHLGVHTHANWVVFHLPFDVDDPGVRVVRFEPHTRVRSDVGALRVGPLCLRAPDTGGVDDPRWTKLTRNGGGGARPFSDWDGDVPHAGRRTLVVSVPSRVANAAACWLPALRQLDTWRLQVTWDARTAR